MKQIQWKKVVGVDWVKENEYWISSNGEIKNASGKIIHQFLNVKKYPSATLVTNTNTRKTICVHRLVVLAFIRVDYRKDGLQVNHIDGNKSNNTIENLELVTNKENSQHRVRELTGQGYCLTQLLIERGHPSVSRWRAYARINRHGWCLEDAISIPVQKIGRPEDKNLYKNRVKNGQVEPS